MSSEAGVTTPAMDVPAGDAGAGAVQADKGDFDARIRQGGDFALEQVKAAQRELSRVKSKVGSVEPIVDAVGGAEALKQHLVRLNTLVSNPHMRALVEEFERTGVAPTAKAIRAAQNAPADDDEFEEPWTRDLNRSQSEVASLRAELNSLRGERGVEKVQGFFSKLDEEFPLDPADRAELADALASQAKSWAADPNGGLNVLKNMDYTTFRALALGKLSKEQIGKAYAREQQAAAGRRAAAATDVPSRIKTQANEGPAGMSPAEAFIAACREVGHDPYRPLT